MDASVNKNWQNYAAAFAIMGNVLLTTPNRLDEPVVDADFWRTFPDFENTQVADARAALCQYLSSSSSAEDEHDATTRASIEQTKLFMGLPEPAAAPWETFYTEEDYAGNTCGFGKATFEMQELLRAHGLALAGENHQYADHIGIELLLLSELCGAAAASNDDQSAVLDAKNFCKEHPLAWVSKLEAKVAETNADGWVAHLLALTKSLMKSLMDL